MPPVEFLPERPAEPAGGPTPGHRGPPRRGVPPRLIAVVAALAFVAAAAVVVATNGTTRHHAAASVTASPSSSAAKPSPSTSGASTLALPESVAFGPRAVDLLADGNRVFALTPTLVGIADRDGGAVTVRPAPLGLSNQTGQPRFVPDLSNRLVWVVAIGGTAIGAYDTDHLDTLANTLAPYPIRGAVAMGEKLYFTTDHGLYSAEAGPGRPQRVAGTKAALGPVAANEIDQQVMAVEVGSPNRMRVLMAYGAVRSRVLPLGHIDSMAVSGRLIWVTAHLRDSSSLFSLDPSTLRVFSVSPIDPQLGPRATIVGNYDNRLLVSSPARHALYCLSAFSGAFKQMWTVPTGAATALNERGLLVVTSAGIQQRNARDCLAG